MKITLTTTRRAVTLLLLCLFAVVPAFARQPRQHLTGHVRDIASNGQAPLVGTLSSGQRIHLSMVFPTRNRETGSWNFAG